MARILVLMRKGEATMNVPLEKVQIWTNDGWNEVARTPVEADAIQPQDIEPSAKLPADEALPSPLSPLPKGEGRNRAKK